MCSCGGVDDHGVMFAYNISQTDRQPNLDSQTENWSLGSSMRSALHKTNFITKAIIINEHGSH